MCDTDTVLLFSFFLFFFWGSVSVQSLGQFGLRGHDRRFSRDPFPVFSTGGPCEQFWHGQGCLIFDIVHPAFPLPTTRQCALKDGFLEAVEACDMPEPREFPPLDSGQKRFLWTHREVDPAPHPVLGFRIIKYTCTAEHAWPKKVCVAGYSVFRNKSILKHNRSVLALHPLPPLFFSPLLYVTSPKTTSDTPLQKWKQQPPTNQILLAILAYLLL